MRLFRSRRLPGRSCSGLPLAPWVFVTVMVTGLLLAGCATTQTTDEPADTEEAPSGPALALLFTQEETGLRIHDVRDDTTRTLVPGASYTGARAVSPSSRYVAFSYTTADSTSLAVVDRTEHTLTPVDTRSADVTYSVAWHPSEERLAFAYYHPTSSGTRGPGDVFVTRPNGAPKDVGCQAAREVLHWLPDGSLATRNDENLYIVAPDGCATRASAEAERIRTTAYAPNGEHLAYLHRELTYNRDANEYTPDTSLFLSDNHGRNAKKLFGADRRVRHLQWSPDATELAFDTHAKESGTRQIAIYRVGANRTVFLTPPSETSAEQVHPQWSPSGTHLGFTLRTETKSYAAVRIEGQTRRFGPVDGTVGPWLDDRTFVVSGPDRLRIHSLDGSTTYERPSPTTLIDAWRPEST